MNKKLVSIAFAGLVSALPFAAQAGGGYQHSRQYDDCDQPRAHQQQHHHHQYHPRHRHAPRVVYVPVPVPAPRVHVPVYYPPVAPVPRGVNIVWRIGF